MNLLTEGPTNVITGQRLKSSLSEPQGHFEPNLHKACLAVVEWFGLFPRKNQTFLSLLQNQWLIL